MNLLKVVNRGIAALIKSVGDAIVDVSVARDVPVDVQPGEDYEPTWVTYGGKGFFEKVDVMDYPGTEIQNGDQTLILLQCSRDVEMHDYVLVGETVHHVHGVKPELVGTTRVLQKLLLREEKKAGIPWESLAQQVA